MSALVRVRGNESDGYPTELALLVSRRIPGEMVGFCDSLEGPSEAGTRTARTPHSKTFSGLAEQALPRRCGGQPPRREGSELCAAARLSAAVHFDLRGVLQAG